MTAPRLDWQAEASVIDRVLHNEQDCYFALLGLYARQTGHERLNGETVIKNYVGFNIVDAPLFTSLALILLTYGSLTPAQLRRCRRCTGIFGMPRLAKYRRQIAEIFATEDLRELKRQLREELGFFDSELQAA